jgi:hypothetical protein
MTDQQSERKRVSKRTKIIGAVTAGVLVVAGLGGWGLYVSRQPKPLQKADSALYDRLVIADGELSKLLAGKDGFIASVTAAPKRDVDGDAASGTPTSSPSVSASGTSESASTGAVSLSPAEQAAADTWLAKDAPEVTALTETVTRCAKTEKTSKTHLDGKATRIGTAKQVKNGASQVVTLVEAEKVTKDTENCVTEVKANETAATKALDDAKTKAGLAKATADNTAAHGVLSKAITDAETVLTGSDGKVTDTKTRDTLKTAIDTAKTVLDAKPGTDMEALETNTKAVTDAAAPLSAPVKTVTDSQAAWQSDQDAKAAAEAAAQAKSGSSSKSGGSSSGTGGSKSSGGAKSGSGSGSKSGGGYTGCKKTNDHRADCYSNGVITDTWWCNAPGKFDSALKCKTEYGIN